MTETYSSSSGTVQVNFAIFISTAGNGGLNALARLSCVIWLGPEGARRCLNVPPATAFAPLNFS